MFRERKILMPFFKRYDIMNVTRYYQKIKRWKRNYARLQSVRRNGIKLLRVLRILAGKNKKRG